MNNNDLERFEQWKKIPIDGLKVVANKLKVGDTIKVIPSVTEIKQKMCDDYCRYTHTCHISGIENICAECPLNYLED